MRAILDTNIFVSCLLGGKLEAILDSLKAGRFTIVVSDDIVSEYNEVLRRPKFGFTEADVDDVMAFIFNNAEFVVPSETFMAIPADPDDNKFIDAAVAGSIELIVSGDKHLLELASFRGSRVVSANAFLKLLKLLN
ncbi:MAG: putative toxin-antitoxin system toxin component, PIN family [Myxococcota bacterium]|jgi:putative PIN family toxin of toxin-antitoxin system